MIDRHKKRLPHLMYERFLKEIEEENHEGALLLGRYYPRIHKEFYYIRRVAIRCEQEGSKLIQLGDDTLGERYFNTARDTISYAIGHYKEIDPSLEHMIPEETPFIYIRNIERELDKFNTTGAFKLLRSLGERHSKDEFFNDQYNIRMVYISFSLFRYDYYKTKIEPEMRKRDFTKADVTLERKLELDEKVLHNFTRYWNAEFSMALKPVTDEVINFLERLSVDIEEFENFDSIIMGICGTRSIRLLNEIMSKKIKEAKVIDFGEFVKELRKIITDEQETA